MTRTEAQEARSRSRRHGAERRMEDALPGEPSLAEPGPIVRPYGDTTGDGMVQVSFTLPLPHDKRAEGAALQLAAKMGLEPALLVHAKDDEARAWYEALDFEPSPTDPFHLFLLLKDLRALIGA